MHMKVLSGEKIKKGEKGRTRQGKALSKNVVSAGV